MHCLGCARKIMKIILRIKGVEAAQFDIRRSQVTIKGNLDPNELVEYVYMRTRKRAVVVKQDSAEESEVSNFVELNYPKQDSGEESEVSNFVELNYRNQSNHYPPLYNGYPRQIFNDENPNACSVM